MSVFNLPQTLSTTNPFNADYATLRRASAADSTNPADTATKVHWSSNASTHVMFFAELDSNGNVTIDVNTSPTTSQPTYVSKVSSTERIHGSITVTNGETIYLQHSSVHLGSFVWNSSYVVAGGTSTEDVLVENASMVFYAGVTGWRFEQRGYAAGAYSLVGGTVNESWTVSNGSNNLQHHISQIPAGGTYYLYSGSNLAATLATTDNKKVFCNFW